MQPVIVCNLIIHGMKNMILSGQFCITCGSCVHYEGNMRELETSIEQIHKMVVDNFFKEVLNVECYDQFDQSRVFDYLIDHELIATTCLAKMVRAYRKYDFDRRNRTDIHFYRMSLDTFIQNYGPPNIYLALIVIICVLYIKKYYLCLYVYFFYIFLHIVPFYAYLIEKKLTICYYILKFVVGKCFPPL